MDTTIDLEKWEISIGKSNGSCHYIWEASEIIWAVL